jgi:hypothetical protein
VPYLIAVFCKLLLLIFIYTLLPEENVGRGAPETAGDTAGPSSRPQEDAEANRGAAGDHVDDTTRALAGDRPEAVEAQGNEV